ncbi:molybdopterin-guanine dinucleotide biosynthesis protein B [Salisediminibacterium beveridgei]|uniref:Molybdopterin-guanine dinucleotide biosynthesis protein MobB n=1 Tax=Salisediminibacterium beveridgei TaxID=632773 RepID=A0A1D7QWL1_9BACI|nr:molybdopterin-guanine dinucleotide biosynthesis protein B [Salisediminibacterium beveridgei]AOM83392.1 Molybdopterin-guanine dinucleotide biosynthesis protein MobB [Salisediminibacterium beveridgei]
MIIHQISGFSNSGKTTIMTGLVSFLKKNGYRVGTIKHHGHSDPLVGEAKQKDATKHREAGAEASIVSSAGGELQLIAHHMKEEFSLHQLIALYIPFQFDIILIEGFKKAEFPKTFVMRDTDDIEQLLEYPEVRAIICPELISHDNVATFSKNQLYSYYDWFLTEIAKDDKNE